MAPAGTTKRQVLLLLAALSAAPPAFASEIECRDFTLHWQGLQPEPAQRQIDQLLFVITEKGCTELVATLLEAGGSVSARDRNGETALLHAAKAGQNEILRQIAARGADLEMRDRLSDIWLSAPDRQLGPVAGSEPAGCRVFVEEVEAHLVLVELPGSLQVGHRDRRDGQCLGQHRLLLHRGTRVCRCLRRVASAA